MKNSNAANPAEAGVINSRYMNSEADYKKFGVKPNTVEVWEDGLRGSEKPNNSEWEWWYFDAIMDDGTSLIIQFLNPALLLPNRAPAVNFQITTPDGKHHRTILESTPDEDSFGEGKCDVHFGRNSFVGDLKNYTLHVEENDQFGADIRFTNLGTPFRPGTAYFAFGDHDEDYYTWLCIAPKCKVEGTLLIDGKQVAVCGYGYHDHQWGSKPYMAFFNNWTWSRQSLNGYSVTMFNMVSCKEYGYKRFPIVFIENEAGEIVFDSYEDVEYTMESTLFDSVSGKTYPAVQRQIFHQGDLTLEYTLTPRKTLESMLHFPNPTPEQAKEFAERGQKPSYMRFLGEGRVKLTKGNDVLIDETGELIYECMFPGLEFK